ncbi:hypothetical protein [Pelagibius sp. Alg239-R121]|uniref:hypothetical protein n=1 Tax=Pelagibius sp. Alg239-R121 TaxID=2993448 RepID=UPI0024A71C6A|nr:hypothetical protein [Pelagibius sp. Alg239-R121]
MFLRFVRSKTVDGLAAREGFFCAAYELRENATLDRHSLERLETLLAWFRKHLTIPNKFNKSTSKGAYRRDAKGLSWFKPNAKDALAKSFELISLLEENGCRIEMLKSKRIGYIVYEDESQVVAEPFSDTPK